MTLLALLEHRGTTPMRNTFGSSGGLLSCSLKGCATVAVGPLPADPRSPHNSFHSTLKGSSRRYPAPIAQKRRPLQGRAVGWRRDPGATLRLPPATLEQAFSLQSWPSIPPCTRTGTFFFLLFRCAGSNQHQPQSRAAGFSPRGRSARRAQTECSNPASENGKRSGRNTSSWFPWAVLLLALGAAPALGQTPGATPAASTQALTENKPLTPDAPLPAELANLDAPRVVHLGNQKLLQGDPESALQAYEHAKTLAPDAREIDFAEGLAEYARGDFERARTLFENAATSANPALVDDAMYSVAATYHQQALQNTDDPKAKIAALEQAMSHYQTVLAHQSDHEAARDANFKAATAWRQLKQQMQQQEQEQKEQGDKNKEENEDQDKEKSDQQQDQQEKDDQEKQDQQKQDKQESDKQEQDKDQQKSESDPSEDPSKEEKQEQQEQEQQQAQQSKEDVSKEQAQRQLREMMQAIRDRKKKQRKQQRPVQIVPVDKDW